VIDAVNHDDETALHIAVKNLSDDTDEFHKEVSNVFALQRPWTQKANHRTFPLNHTNVSECLFAEAVDYLLATT